MPPGKERRSGRRAGAPRGRGRTSRWRACRSPPESGRARCGGPPTGSAARRDGAIPNAVRPRIDAGDLDAPAPQLNRPRFVGKQRRRPELYVRARLRERIARVRQVVVAEDGVARGQAGRAAPAAWLATRPRHQVAADEGQVRLAADRPLDRPLDRLLPARRQSEMEDRTGVRSADPSALPGALAAGRAARAAGPTRPRSGPRRGPPARRRPAPPLPGPGAQTSNFRRWAGRRRCAA